MSCKHQGNILLTCIPATSRGLCLLLESWPILLAALPVCRFSNWGFTLVLFYNIYWESISAIYYSQISSMRNHFPWISVVRNIPKGVKWNHPDIFCGQLDPQPRSVSGFEHRADCGFGLLQAAKLLLILILTHGAFTNATMQKYQQNVQPFSGSEMR